VKEIEETDLILALANLVLIAVRLDKKFIFLSPKGCRTSSGHFMRLLLVPLERVHNTFGQKTKDLRVRISSRKKGK
jgi:hypothetical protein